MDIEGQAPEGARRRGIVARIGIALLNLVLPGLGLQRLSQPRLWLFYMLLQIAADAVLLAVFALVRDISFPGFFAAVGVYLLVMLAAIVGSIWQSWRHSAIVAPASRWWSRWYGLLLVWACMAGLASLTNGAIHSFYKTYYIPAESMMPALRVNDRLLADMRPGALKRGDVVIVSAGRTDYVKRIAALPGDRIAMRGGVPFINGVAVPQTEVGRVAMREDGSVTEGKIFLERLPGEARNHLVTDLGYSDGDNVAEIRMGPNDYYLLGDNRDRSADSRYPPSEMGLGVVDRARIKGRVLFRYWRPGTGFGAATL